MTAPDPTSPTRLRVLIVHADEDYRTLLRLRLNADGRFAVVGEAGSASGALSAVSGASPDAVVVDAPIRRDGEVDLVAALREHHPDVRSVVLTDSKTSPAQTAGAYAHVDKSTSLEPVLNVLAPLASPDPEP